MPTSLELRTRVRLLWLETDRATAGDFSVWADCNWVARTALALADAFERQGDGIGAAQRPLPFFICATDRLPRPPGNANDP
jgi:hypothetical protein